MRTYCSKLEEMKSRLTLALTNGLREACWQPGTREKSFPLGGIRYHIGRLPLSHAIYRCVRALPLGKGEPIDEKIVLK